MHGQPHIRLTKKSRRIFVRTLLHRTSPVRDRRQLRCSAQAAWTKTVTFRTLPCERAWNEALCHLRLSSKEEMKQTRDEGKIAVNRSSCLTSRNTAAAFGLNVLLYPFTAKGQGYEGRPWVWRFCSRKTISPTSWRGPKGTSASIFEWGTGKTACRMWEKTALSGKATGTSRNLVSVETSDRLGHRKPLKTRVTGDLW